MAQYMLLLYSNPSDWKTMSPEDIQKAILKFSAWREKVRGRNLLLGSHKLADEPGKVMRGKGPVRVTDGPYSETKEVLGGYFLIEAPNYNAAVDLARDCPGLEYGGTIEVREVDSMMPGK
jgi:hypothetical protein